ncbi:MAG TPA: hypothetical protein VGV92_04485 [Gammaproteobacteria bacterium]|nr:hypothetical protein [Gammaproteobacteria bacterium]
MRESAPGTPRPLDIFAVIVEAWQLTKGAKWAINAVQLTVLGVYILAMAIGTGVLFLLFPDVITQVATKGYDGISSSFVITLFIIFIAVFYVTYGLLAGVIKVSIERARGNPISAAMGFNYFSRALPLIVTQIILWLFLIPGIFLDLFHIPFLMTLYSFIISSFFYLSLPLVVDRISSPFAAISHSYETIRPHWLKIVGIAALIYMIYFNLSIPLRIGLHTHNYNLVMFGMALILIAMIWIGPFIFLLQGVVYHKLIDSAVTIRSTVSAPVIPPLAPSLSVSQAESARIQRELKEELMKEAFPEITKMRSLRVFGTINETWRKTKGIRLAILAPMIASVLIAILGVWLMTVFFTLVHVISNGPIAGGMGLIGGAIIATATLYIVMGLYSGMIKASIDCARDQAVSINASFHAFSHAVPALLTGLGFIIILIPQFFIPAIFGLESRSLGTVFTASILQMTYFALVIPFLFISMPIVVDRTHSPIKALSYSIKTALRYWTRLFGISLYISLVLLLLIIAPPLLAMILQNVMITDFLKLCSFVCFILLTPFFCLVQGIVYHKLID